MNVLPRAATLAEASGRGKGATNRRREPPPAGVTKGRFAGGAECGVAATKGNRVVRRLSEGTGCD